MLLSIIIPVYNLEKYIVTCLDSLLKQSPTEAEIICIDDCSTDRSGAILDDYKKEFTNIIVKHMETNVGVAVSRNVGLKLAKGEYVAWIDGDDYLADDWYSSIIYVLQEKKPDLLAFDYCSDIDGSITPKLYLDKSQYVNQIKFMQDTIEDRIQQNYLWDKVLKKEILRTVVFPEWCRRMSDCAVMGNILDKVEKIFYLHKCLYFYRFRPDSVVNAFNLTYTYYGAFLARNNYKTLIVKYPGISSVGYLTQSLYFAQQFLNADQETKKKHTQEYYNVRKFLMEKLFFFLFSKKFTSLQKKDVLTFCLKKQI